MHAEIRVYNCYSNPRYCIWWMKFWSLVCASKVDLVLWSVFIRIRTFLIKLMIYYKFSQNSDNSQGEDISWWGSSDSDESTRNPKPIWPVWWNWSPALRNRFKLRLIVCGIIFTWRPPSFRFWRGSSLPRNIARIKVGSTLYLNMPVIGLIQELLLFNNMYWDFSLIELKGVNTNYSLCTNLPYAVW